MNLFLGSHQNRLDAKGRVSVPANFRLALRKLSTSENNGTLILRPSHTLPCVEGWPVSLFEKLTTVVDNIDIFSAMHNEIATLLYAQAWPVDLDREGRILLPDILKEHATLTNVTTFMGLGTIFQIWEPKAAKKHYEKIIQHTKMTVLSHISPNTVDQLGKQS